jgi:hypothetical protein
MTAFWSTTARAFASSTPEAVLGELARRQVHHFRTTEAEQTPAWRDSIIALQAALQPHPTAWVLLEYPMLRLGRRIDAVVLTDRAILVLEFKRTQADADALRQTEDYGLDLYDFHEHSRRHPIVPILVTDGAPATPTDASLYLGVSPVRQTRPENLGAEITAILQAIGPPARALDPAVWIGGAYRPVPTIIEAACMLYSRNGVAEIAAARADQRNLHETTLALRQALAAHLQAGTKVILFVTGIPGAGKTLCGLNAAFTPKTDAETAETGTFLTGNPTLVHVLREALARDAIKSGANPRIARRRMESVIQALPRFRNHYLEHPTEHPPETVFVIDEAQRCWSRDYAIRKTRDKPTQLTDSEPGHLLDIAARHEAFAGIVCLVGSGQEIHDGEGGLAEWGQALSTRPEWQAVAPPDIAATSQTDPRRCLGPQPHLTLNRNLHLDVPIRQIRSTTASAWVDAVLQSDATLARAIAAETTLPFTITRSLPELRRALRTLARGERRAGLLASSGARRLRAEGLGAELPHMDAAAVAHWFLDRFPRDVRASDALEQVATEFSCQGLELDYVGLCWDADLIRAPRADTWLPRNFVGTRWQHIHSAEAAANQLNTYRVLLTRARYETIIFIPRGDAADATRTPRIYDEIAEFLVECGAEELDLAKLACASQKELGGPSRSAHSGDKAAPLLQLELAT